MLRPLAVTGGTGFLGSHIARRLIADGIHPVLFDIAALPSDDDDIKDQLTVIDGDVTDREAIRAALKGVEVVIHTAAALPIQAAKSKIYAANVRGTRYVLHEALKAGVKRVVSSRAGVYGFPRFTPSTKSADDPAWALRRSKVEAEKICHQYQRRGLEVNISGRRRSSAWPVGVFEILFEWMRRPAHPLLATARTTTSFLK